MSLLCTRLQRIGASRRHPCPSLRPSRIPNKENVREVPEMQIASHDRTAPEPCGCENDCICNTAGDDPVPEEACRFCYVPVNRKHRAPPEHIPDAGIDHLLSGRCVLLRHFRDGHRRDEEIGIAFDDLPGSGFRVLPVLDPCPGVNEVRDRDPPPRPAQTVRYPGCIPLSRGGVSCAPVSGRL